MLQDQKMEVTDVMKLAEAGGREAVNSVSAYGFKCTFWSTCSGCLHVNK